MAEPVLVTLVLNCRPELVDDVCTGFTQALEETRRFKGFRNIIVHRNADVPSRVILIEEWDSREDYDAYMARRMSGDGQSAFDELLTAPPELQFWNVKVAAADRG